MLRSSHFFGCFALLATMLVVEIHAEHVAAVTWETDADRAYQTAKEQQRLLLLYFTMEECIFCRKMEQETLAVPTVVADIREDFVAASLKAEENDALVRKLRVQTFPTTVIISPSSGVVDYMPGYVKANEFKNRLSVATKAGEPQGRRLLLGRRERNENARSAGQ